MCFGGETHSTGSSYTLSLSPPVIQEFLQRFQTNVFLIVFLSVPEKVSPPFFFFFITASSFSLHFDISHRHLKMRRNEKEEHNATAFHIACREEKWNCFDNVKNIDVLAVQ